MGPQTMTPKILSAEEVKRVAGTRGYRNSVVLWHTANLTVKKILTLKEFIETVRRILHDCETEDGGVAIELIDFAIKSNIIISYGYVDLPEDPEEMYYVVYYSDLYETICSAVCKKQVGAIIDTVNMYVG